VDHLLSALVDLPVAHAHRNLLACREVRCFATAPETLDFIRPSLGPDAFPVRGVLFDKIPGANWKVTWHQDLSIAVRERMDVPGFGPWSLKEGVHHVQPPESVLRGILTLRLHLDDCFEDNGPLRLLAGSHGGIWNSDQIRELRAHLRETVATVAAGGILLMRPLCLHASSPASNPHHRRVVHIEYAAAPLPAPLRWHAS
jgi:ectoine hydroxylase-related dioxygenase (phytanoyl-CoA dioxygenase family)